MSIDVLLVDDQTLVRAGFRSLLEHSDDIRVVGEAAEGEHACHLATRLRPDVVLMDIRMPGVNGIEATRRIGADSALRAVRVVVLTTFEDEQNVFDALQAGASGFLAKDIEAEDLRQAVRVVAAGEALLSPRVTRRLIGEFVTSRPVYDGTPLDVLTDREREVVALVAEGLTNGEIGDRLGMSTATARTHVGRSMSKLDARDRAQLVVVAYRTGLVRPGG